MDKRNSSILLEIINVDEASKKEESDNFFRNHIDLTKGPQIKALLICGEQKDRLILKVHHLMCDAGGFKSLLNLLSDIY